MGRPGGPPLLLCHSGRRAADTQRLPGQLSARLSSLITTGRRNQDHCQQQPPKLNFSLTSVVWTIGHYDIILCFYFKLIIKND